ncbi:hypothetical protein AB7M63_005661 [Bradyrhizobium japonicum]
MPVTPAASWPPGIGVAKVYVGATRKRSESELEVCGGQATSRKSKGSVSFFAELGKLLLMVGLVLTERAARLVKQEPTQAPIGFGGLVDAPPTAE